MSHSKQKRKLAGALYLALNESGMSQTEASKRLNIQPSTFSGMIHHPEEFSVKTLSNVRNELDDLVDKMHLIINDDSKLKKEKKALGLL